MTDFSFPTSPTTLTNVIPSYLYVQYADDDALQAFVSSYNQIAQQYVTFFAYGQLPVYTQLSGTLLDWVARGLYGQGRPALASVASESIGPFNTAAYNVLPYDGQRVLAPKNVTAVTDDIFKRILTWNFFRGDGVTFNIRWLKRRVMRFLFGVDGADTTATANTDQVSVTFGSGGVVSITLITGIRTITGGMIFNRTAYGGYLGHAYNQLTTSFTPLNPLPNSELLREAMAAGVLNLPFQFSYVVNVG